MSFAFLDLVLILCSLFETFDVVSDDVAPSDRLQLLHMTAKCSTEELGNEVISPHQYIPYFS